MTQREAIVQANEGPPYTGRPGQTRLETVHLAADDGSVDALQVYRVVNVVTHPELLDRVLSGELHRVPGGPVLALPFVYHDPAQRKFALVVPPSVAHLELKEWANLMQELAADTSVAVPRYVRDAMTVIGFPSLARYLEAPAELQDNELSEAEPDPVREGQSLEDEAYEVMDSEVTASEATVSEATVSEATVSEATVSEATVSEGAVGAEPSPEASAAAEETAAPVASHDAAAPVATGDGPVMAAAGEGAPALEPPPLPAADALSESEGQADSALEARLREQEERLLSMAEALSAREADLRQLEGQLEAQRTDLEVRAQELQAVAALPGSPVATDDSVGWQELLAGELSASMPDILEPPRTSVPPPLRVRRRTGPPPLRPRGRIPAQQPPPLLGDGSPSRAPSAAPAEDAIVRPPPLPEVVADAELVEIPSGAIAAEEVHRSNSHPEVEPPGGAPAASPRRMTHRLSNEELWLFASWPEGELQELRASPDLMLQCIDSDGCPVLVLSLYAHGAGTRGNVARAAIGGTDAHGRAVLDCLEQSFRARIAIYVDGVYRETLTVSMLREGVARAAREHLKDRFPDPAAGPQAAAIDDAVERVLLSPPSLDNPDLPFGPARRRMSGTFAVAAAVAQLHSWMLPERLREATLRYGVPQHVVEASARRVLRAAVLHGIALPRDLSDLAVRYTVAKSDQSLIAEQLSHFKQRLVAGENDLDPVATERNWERLFQGAARLGVVVDPELRTLAQATESPVAAESAPPVARPLESLTEAQIADRLTDPELCATAFVELCQRDHLSVLPALVRAMGDLGDDELRVCSPHLLAFGEAAVDPVAEALGHTSMAVRQAAALLLGQLQAPRAIRPLVRLLDAEATAIWSEVARALGEFGSAAIPELVSAVPGAANPERLQVALAHAANHGAAQDLENLESHTLDVVAAAARDAASRRARLEWEDLAIREQRPLSNSSAAAFFSQEFYAEASRVRE